MEFEENFTCDVKSREKKWSKVNSNVIIMIAMQCPQMWARRDTLADALSAVY